MIDRAYALAYFILRRPESARQAAEEALARLEVAMSAQHKRLYYEPCRRGTTPAPRTVWLNEAQQLQRLVYITCEPHERRSERGDEGGAAREDDLLVHFIKHLARITIRRNAFHAVLGVGRLLFRYATAEVMEIHNQLVDLPEDVKDESYYRARKGVLMQEMVERFDGLLTVVRQQRGEARFLTADDGPRYAPLVAECLERFVPWDTTCDGGASTPFCTRSADPEMQRVHGALCPHCLRRVVTTLGLPRLEARLAVPCFRRGGADDEDAMTQDRKTPPPLPPGERSRLEQARQHRAGARNSALVMELRIVIDGRECARFDPAADSRVSLDLPDGAELLEVWSGDARSEVLLAAALLDDAGRTDAAPIAITLEAGQRVAARVNGRTVSVSYHETGPWRALAQTRRRLHHRLRTMARPARLVWPAVGTLAVVLAAVLITPRLASPPSPAAADRTANDGMPPAPHLRSGRNDRHGRGVATRLRDVRRLFVEVTGPPPLVDELTRKLASALRSTPFVVVEPTEKGTADAALKVAITSKGPSQVPGEGASAHPVSLLARVVNVEGGILWPEGLSRGGHQVEGTLDEGVELIVRELSREALAEH